MAQTQEFMVNCGTTKVPARLPLERTRIAPGPPASATPLPDAAAKFRQALADPVGMPALQKLVKKGAKVTIGIQDGRAVHYHPEDQDLRILGLPILMELLQECGVRPEDIQIKVANALHRMWTRKEMTHILGPRLPYTLGGRLSCIDATDISQFVNLGITKRGMEVMVHRAVGHSVQDPKNSAFHKLLNEMGELVEAELARRGHPPIMKIEGILTTSKPQKFAAIDAGLITPVREMHLDMLVSELVTDVKGQTDVLLIGMADGDSYSRLSVFNPIHCRNKALSGLFNAYHENPLVRKGGIFIVANPFEPKFSLLNHPSYHALYNDVLPAVKDPIEVWDTYSEEYAHRPEFVHKYRTGFAFHGAHPCILYGQGLYALNHLGSVFAAGVPNENEDVARRMGFEPFPTIDAALREAEARLGKDCSITYHPHLEEQTYFTRVNVNGN